MSEEECCTVCKHQKIGGGVQQLLSLKFFAALIPLDYLTSIFHLTSRYLQPNSTLFKPKKVYFIWTTREQSAPQYFRQTLEELKGMDNSNFLEINIYITTAGVQNDLRSTIAKVSTARYRYNNHN